MVVTYIDDIYYKNEKEMIGLILYALIA